VDGDGHFTCHVTTVLEDDEMIEGPNAQHCAGAMILLHYLEMPNQLMRISARLRRTAPVDPDNPLDLKLDSPIFHTFEEMEDAQDR